jgi:hypothetical protein
VIFGFVKKALGAARQARDSVNGWSALTDAYEAGAALPGVLLAYTGTTPGAADNLLPALVMETVASVHTFVGRAAYALEHGAQTLSMAGVMLTDISLELREVEALLDALRGGQPLKDVLEAP